MSGFDLVADHVELAERMERADLVITGEGLLDDQSFEGKTVGGVLDMAAELGVPVVVLAGDVEGTFEVDHRALVTEVGEAAAWEDPLGSLRKVAAEVLAGR
jgi:glycerate kinase